MLNVKTLILIVASIVLVLHCGTSSKSQQLKDGTGRVIGRYDVLSDSEARANFDVNQNGINERVASYKDKKLVAVEYFDDTTGAKTKTVQFRDDKPESVNVFDKSGKEIRGNVVYDLEKNTAKEVILPAKSKKVIFNGDGTVSVTDIENK
jgi:hypothetical protein